MSNSPDSPDWLRSDSGGSHYCLRSYEIFMDFPDSLLARLATEDISNNDIPVLATIWHELFHWVQLHCTSFGFLITFLINTKLAMAMRIALHVQAQGHLRKPVLKNLPEHANEHITGEVKVYLAVHKLIDVLLGAEECSTKTFTELLFDALPVFSLAPQALTYPTQETLTMEDAERIRRTFKETESWGGEADSAGKAYAEYLHVIGFAQKLGRSSRDDTLHPSIRYNEVLTPIALWESWAKYFEAGYAEVLSTLRGNPIDAPMEWEQWDSIYVRAFRTMMEITAPAKAGAYDLSDLLVFLALADLACNPSLSTKWIFPDILSTSFEDFVPGRRFIRAARIAAQIRPISPLRFENLESDYRFFVGEVCARLGWEPPWLQANNWLEAHPKRSRFYGIFQFLAACELRIERPLFFGLPIVPLGDHGDEQWASLLRHLPIPAVHAKDSKRLFWFSPDHAHPAAIAQWFTLQEACILDQVMLKDGPIDWAAVLHTNDPRGSASLIQHLSLHGIDLHSIAVGDDDIVSGLPDSQGTL